MTERSAPSDQMHCGGQMRPASGPKPRGGAGVSRRWFAAARGWWAGTWPRRESAGADPSGHAGTLWPLWAGGPRASPAPRLGPQYRADQFQGEQR
jgi:hypothetical protein